MFPRVAEKYGDAQKKTANGKPRQPFWHLNITIGQVGQKKIDTDKESTSGFLCSSFFKTKHRTHIFFT